jgi:hypothetical protein
MALHSSLSSGRWGKLTLAAQLGNVGSEFGRAARAQESGNTSRFDNAIDRLYELVDLTLTDRRWTLPQRREISRLRESISETFFGEDQTKESRDVLDRYLYYFGVLARKGI